MNVLLLFFLVVTISFFIYIFEQRERKNKQKINYGHCLLNVQLPWMVSFDNS